MKKYRLIEYKFDSQKTLGVFSTFEEAAYSMRDKTKQLYSYRIDEVEESIMDRVKTVEDAWEITDKGGSGPSNRRWMLSEATRIFGEYPAKHLMVLKDLEKITAALNEGWKPDWEDKEQKKWYVSYYAKEDFFHAAVAKDINLCTSSRLYFKSRELAEYAAKQFGELYKQLLIEAF